MADQVKSLADKVESNKKFDKAGEGKPADRQRKVYDHELSTSERFALQAFQKARNALTACCEHLQEGKGCTSEMVTQAIALQASAALMLFAKP